MAAACKCHSCTLELQEVDKIVCNGFCRSTFHFKCVKITTAAWETVSSSANMFWMCNACTKMMANASFRNAISSTNAATKLVSDEHTKILCELKKEIEQNTAKINAILHQPRFSEITPIRTMDTNEGQGSRKRRRLLDGVDVSGPISRETKEMAPTVSIPLAPNRKTSDLFWLYLSGFAPEATIEQVADLVKQNLSTDETVDVTKLVPKGKNLDELTFVSFKVGVGPQHKDAALSAET